MASLSHLHPEDRLWSMLLLLVAIASGLILVLVTGFLLWETAPFFQSVGIARLVRDPNWAPTLAEYNVIPMVLGSLLVTLGALLLSVPLGLGSAIFCQFYAPQAIAVLYRRMLELLAGIPSVVYGFWGLVVLVPLIAALQAPGPSLLAGSIILALMVLPTIALIAENSLIQLPPSYWKSSRAMGLGRWSTIVRVSLPAARTGIMTAIILAFGRAMGETMAVVMVCGNAVQVPNSVFDPVRTLTANIALEMAYAVDFHRSALFVSGLILVVIVALSIGILSHRTRLNLPRTVL
ncbi:MAG: phosphate ABC transporter permease subunit PstC [Cyanobacteria bacterium P01_F01_bin.42]